MPNTIVNGDHSQDAVQSGQDITFEPMQVGADARLPRPIEAIREHVGDGIGDAKPYAAVLSLYVFTHQNNAAVSCRLYRAEEGDQPKDLMLSAPDGNLGRTMVHTSMMDLPEGTTPVEAIRCALKVLREQELATFAAASDEGRAALGTAFDEAAERLLGSLGE